MSYKIYYHKKGDMSSSYVLQTFNCDHPGQVLAILADFEKFKEVVRYRVFGMSSQRVMPKDFGKSEKEFTKWDQTYP